MRGSMRLLNLVRTSRGIVDHRALKVTPLLCFQFQSCRTLKLQAPLREHSSSSEQSKDSDPFVQKLHAELDKYHLLNHVFYTYWNCGKLSKPVLQRYAEEYYHHVAAFPRYISTIHSNCEDIADRQTLLGNLIEEEQGSENHPELWLRFAEGLGSKRDTILQKDHTLPTTQALVDGYFDLVKSDFAKGLAALYAYERQTPAVADSKMEGLQKFYGVTSPRSLQFFDVHKSADVWHSDECLQMLKKCNEVQKKAALEGAVDGAKLLWKFLDGMLEHAKEVQGSELDAPAQSQN